MDRIGTGGEVIPGVRALVPPCSPISSPGHYYQWRAGPMHRIETDEPDEPDEPDRIGRYA